MIGFGEILLIGGVLVIIFGATQIPKIAKSIGEGLKEFKKSVKEAKAMDQEDQTDDDKNKKSST